MLLATLPGVTESSRKRPIHPVDEFCQVIVVPIFARSVRPDVVRLQRALLPSAQEQATLAGVLPHALGVVRLKMLGAQPAVKGREPSGVLGDVPPTLPPQCRGCASGEVAQRARAGAGLVQVWPVARGASPKELVDLVHCSGLQQLRPHAHAHQPAHALRDRTIATLSARNEGDEVAELRFAAAAAAAVEAVEEALPGQRLLQPMEAFEPEVVQAQVVCARLPREADLEGVGRP
mmetsp:Transcript_45843/g.147219  ORF Transcript_45843/g.147219 Transcript_45843/m.147219 type:complete len:234 (+) Transcript_45843:81-782(+)